MIGRRLSATVQRIFRSTLLLMLLFASTLAFADPDIWAVAVTSPKEAFVGEVKLDIVDVPGFMRGQDPYLKKPVYIRVRNTDTPYAAVHELIAGLRRVGYANINLVAEDGGENPTQQSSPNAELKNKKLATEEDVRAALNKQLEPCLRLPGTSGKDIPVVTAKFHLKMDGSIDGEVTVLNPLDTPLFKIAAHATVRGVKGCAPFRLPADRYDLWNTVTWNFDWPLILGTKPAPPAVNTEARDWYKRAVIARIMDTARKARPDITSGKAHLTVVLEADGKIQAAGAIRVEGIPEIDRIASGAAWEARPFPAFSPDMGKDNLYVVETLDFSKPADEPDDVYAGLIVERTRAKMGPPPDGQTGSAKVFLRLDAQGGIA